MLRCPVAGIIEITGAMEDCREEDMP